VPRSFQHSLRVIGHSSSSPFSVHNCCCQRPLGRVQQCQDRSALFHSHLARVLVSVILPRHRFRCTTAAVSVLRVERSSAKIYPLSAMDLNTVPICRLRLLWGCLFVCGLSSVSVAGCLAYSPWTSAAATSLGSSTDR
jgi:hypothetical protein